MKTINLLLLALSCAVVRLPAQIQAGDTDDVIYTPLGIGLELLDNPLESFQVVSDSIDVDNDGTDDISFDLTLANVPDFVGSVAGVAVLHPGVEVMTTGYLATQLQIGEDILPDSNWSNSLTWTLAANYNGLIGPTSYGEWLNTTSGYLAVRVIQPTDTLYGWLDVYALSTVDSVKLKVIGVGLEPIINGTVESGIKDLKVFPNPASESLIIPPDEYSRLEVYSADGKLVKAMDGASFEKINLSGLAPGMYHLVLYKGKQRWLGRVIKQ